MKRPIAILAVLAAIASVALPEFGAAQPQENLAACCQQQRQAYVRGGAWPARGFGQYF